MYDGPFLEFIDFLTALTPGVFPIPDTGFKASKTKLPTLPAPLTAGVPGNNIASKGKYSAVPEAGVLAFKASAFSLRNLSCSVSNLGFSVGVLIDALGASLPTDEE